MSSAIAAMAQGPADALLYTTNTYTGTARTLAMGNAFVALGGDIGAISVNPASSAIYRYSEVSITPALVNAASTSTVPGIVSRESFTSFKLNSTGFVSAFDTYRNRGLLNYSFSLSVNRIADFNRSGSGSWTTGQSSILAPMTEYLQGTEYYKIDMDYTSDPYRNTNLDWLPIMAYNTFLIDRNPSDALDRYIGATQNEVAPGVYEIGGNLHQNYFTKSTGGITEFTLNMGFNISDILYFGANLNLHSVDYANSSYYSEVALNSRDFDDGFYSMSSETFLRTVGSGVNFEIGAILTPVAGLRLGATFTTPTVYNLMDVLSYRMKSSFDNGNGYTRNSPDWETHYRVISPVRWSVGAAYTFEKFALVSVDWEGIDYSRLAMANSVGNKSEWINENQRISNGFRLSSNLRAGLEIRPLEVLYLRGGYNLFTTAGNLVDNYGKVTYSYPDTQYLSCGVGFRFGSKLAGSIDFAYQRMLGSKEWYNVYAGAPTVDALNYLNRFALTFAYRF